MDEHGQEPVEELTLEVPGTVRTQRRRALWAVLGFMGLVAGGLVVSSANDDGGERPGLPVDLASSTREAGAADSVMAWFVYVPGDDLPSLGGEATAYRLSGDVDETQVRALADELGLDAAVVDDGGGGWSVTGEGGLGRLDVHADSGASWSYFGGYADCVTEEGGVVSCYGQGSDCAATDQAAKPCSIAEAGGSGGCDGTPETPCVPTTTVPECGGPAVDCIDDQPVTDDPAVAEPRDTGSDCAHDDCIAPDVAVPAPAVGLEGTTTPPDDVAQVALDVVAASGADVDDASVTGLPGAGEDVSDVWYVMVEPRLDGVPSGLISSIVVSADLQVISGNGFLGQPEAVGDYPLLDTRAAIDRANAQRGAFGGIEPAVGAAEDAVTSTTGGTDAGVTDDRDATVTTVVGSADPCAPLEGSDDGCGGGGTTDCGGDGCVEPTSTIPCKVQADGSEVCEVIECSVGVAVGEERRTNDSVASAQPCDVPSCPQPQPLPPLGSDSAPETTECAPTPTVPVPEPVPAPEALEVVLVDAERSLVLLPSNDGSGDAYLVPAYRFTVADGGTVDLPAVADEALSGPATTETTVPDTTEPAPVPVPEPLPCEVLEEQDPGTETTHTIQTCPTPEDDLLQIGGDGYYVDVDVECAGGSFVLGGRVWVTEDEAVAGWADPGERHEGGTFTLDAEDHGTFVGDAAGTLTAEFRTLGPNEDIFCQPQPR